MPELPGVIGYGADAHECARELYRLIEDTLRTWLADGYPVPVIDGIDLNSNKNRVLASYHPHIDRVDPGGEHYEDEVELERAFESRGKTA
ncbi:MAG: hypothetical protein ACR2JC_05740 [Chloroflexota bacterium]|nr:MAG: hypothetical protein DLM70_16415 [Chloroflexota bacterium]